MCLALSLFFDEHKKFWFNGQFDLVPFHLNKGIEIGEMAGLEFQHLVRVCRKIVLETVDTTAGAHEADDPPEELGQDDDLIGDG